MNNPNPLVLTDGKEYLGKECCDKLADNFIQAFFLAATFLPVRQAGM